MRSPLAASRMTSPYIEALKFDHIQSWNDDITRIRQHALSFDNSVALLEHMKIVHIHAYTNGLFFAFASLSWGDPAATASKFVCKGWLPSAE